MIFTALIAFWFGLPCEPLRVIDGDTVVAKVTLPTNMVWVESFRLLGCDAYEHKDPKGPAATQFAKDFLSSGTVILWTEGERGKFGRPLATFEVDGVLLNDALTSAELTTGRWYRDLSDIPTLTDRGEVPWSLGGMLWKELERRKNSDSSSN